MLDGPPGARSPRPVAGVPPPALADGAVVAKAWLMALLDAAPLAGAARVPVDRIAAEGPALCAAALRAVGSREDLARLGPDGDLAPLAALAGALAGAGDPAEAVAAVAALRGALWSALGATTRDHDVASFARVAHVADVIAQAVLAGSAIAEDLAAAEQPWLAAVRARAATAPRRFAVLVVEVVDADRLLTAGGRDAAIVERAEGAVRAAVRPGDVVVRERAGRVWVVADGLDGEGARALGEHVAGALAADAGTHGAAPVVAVGLAACPADGSDAATLAARADERLFAARAAGVRMIGA